MMEVKLFHWALEYDFSSIEEMVEWGNSINIYNENMNFGKALFPIDNKRIWKVVLSLFIDKETRTNKIHKLKVVY